jgi:glutathione S-transferase
MITLYTFGPFFGLPDGSPFVTKTMLLLKFAGLDYRDDRGGYRKAPKGKLPFIDDDGAALAVLLGDKPYLFGAAPCGADATVGAFVMGLLAPIFETPIRTALEAQSNLVAYADRLKKSYFPELG